MTETATFQGRQPGERRQVPAPAPARPDLGAPGAAKLVVACMVLNAALALHNLSGRSLWLDEGASWLISVQHGSMLWNAVAHEGGDQLLYYLFLHVSILVFGTSPAALRFPSVVLGMASIPLVYALGRRVLGSRWAGVASAALMAVALPLVFWQQNARAYSLDVALAAATNLLFLLAVRDRRRGAMAGWTVLTAAAIYAHPLAVLVVAAQLPVVLLVRPDRALLARLGAAIVGVIVACIPFAFVAAHRGAGQIAWISRPHPKAIEGLVEFLSGASGGLVTRVYPALAIATAVVWVIALVGLVVHFIRFGLAAQTVGVALLVAGVVVPPAADYLGSYVVQPVFIERYLIICLPAAVVLLVAGLCALGPKPLTVAGVTAFFLVRLAVSVPAYGQSVEPDAATARYIVTHAQPADCVTFYINSVRVEYDYYLRRWGDRGPTQVLPSVSSTMPLAALKRLDDLSVAQTLALDTPARLRALRSCHRLWLISGHYGVRFGPPSTRAQYDGYVRLRRQLDLRWRHVQKDTALLQLFSGRTSHP